MEHVGQYVWYFAAAAVAAGFGMAWASAGVVKGQSNALTKAMEGIARQPESAKPIFLPLILGLAFMELLGLLAFVVAMVITFPLTATVVNLFKGGH